MRPQPGTVLGGRYELTSRIAVGGMGEVWKGRDRVIDREVAAKILKEEYLSDQGFLDRFRAEARSMGAVSHPGIAAVFDYGEENGSPYLVMEYVPGEPLSALIDRNGVLPEGDVLELTALSAEALGSAHRSGVVHRDVKPGNILVTPDFRVKLTDFGIARVADQAPLTKTGQVMGTAQYLAPEQATGKGSTPKSDLYSLGIIMYEALAGRRPFTGDSQVAIAIAQVNTAAPELPDTISEPIRRLVACLLGKKQDERPESGEALAAAARALRSGDTAAAEAAVPQMLAGAAAGAAATAAVTQAFHQPGEDETRVMDPAQASAAAAPAPTTATRAIPQQDDVEERPEDQLDEDEKKMGTGMKVTIGVLIALVLAGLVWVAWIFFGPPGEPEPTGSATPTAESTEEQDTTVEIDPNDYIGQSEATATRNLEQQGLVVDTVDAESQQAEGTVVNVRPGDNGYVFNEGDGITLEVSSGPAEEPEPEPEPEQPGSDSGSDGSSDSGSDGSSDSGSGGGTDGGSDSQGGSDDGTDGSNDTDGGTDSGSNGGSGEDGDSSSGSNGDSESGSGDDGDSSSGSNGGDNGGSNSSDGDNSGNADGSDDGGGEDDPGLGTMNLPGPEIPRGSAANGGD